MMQMLSMVMVAQLFVKYKLIILAVVHLQYVLKKQLAEMVL
jgi:hypothetical protein